MEKRSSSTARPGRNLKLCGLGVASVWMNMEREAPATAANGDGARRRAASRAPAAGSDMSARDCSATRAAVAAAGARRASARRAVEATSILGLGGGLTNGGWSTPRLGVMVGATQHQVDATAASSQSGMCRTLGQTK